MRRLTKQLAAPLVAAVALWLVVRTFVITGLVVPIHVSGSSMAPALPGAGALLSCPACQSQFRVGLDQWPTADARCVACGERFQPPVFGQHLPGTRLWIDRWSGELAGLKRWQTVVFRCPNDASELCIKRILALPGETIDFADGDVWIDGTRIVKSLDEQLALRVLVHRETDELQFWRGDNCTFANDRWTLDATHADVQLTFDPPLGHVTDDLPANQSLVHRTERVDDLMLAFHLKLDDGADLQLSIDDQRIDNITGPFDDRLLWSTFDRRTMLAVGDQVVWQRDWPADWRPEHIELTASGGVATLGGLTLYRDVHYTWRPTDLRPPLGWRLPAGEFFVVGDNQSLSFDSRNWPHRAGLPRRLILGTAVGSSHVEEQ